MTDPSATILSTQEDAFGAASELSLVNFEDQPPVIVIGSGPSGVRFCHALLKRNNTQRVVLFGDEPVVPYNRVQLSALLAGEVSQADISNPLPSQAEHPNFSYICSKIKKIDSDSAQVEDETGNLYSYSKLILATGSLPHQPNIPGIDLPGVYTFRNMKDTEYLYSRTARSRHIVVVGGGLLGIEAARALQKSNTKVTLVQQADRLMNRQLDETASQLLRDRVESCGITVITSSGARAILGEERVQSVRLHNEEIIECDTVLICAGVKPNLELARQAKLKIATGIVVGDRLESSVENIFAIGECCEHRSKTYGLVSPGLEQASVAASVVAGQEDLHYAGSFGVNRLKVIGENVCSMGEVSELTFKVRQYEWIYQSKKKNIYRKIVATKGRISGILCFGEWDEVSRAQEAWQNQRRIMPWNIIRFLLTGFLWGKESNIDQWPSSTVVCQCNNISQGELKAAIANGCDNVQLLRETTRAGTTCGSCKPLLEQMIGSPSIREKELAWPLVLASSLGALIIVSLLIFLPAISVSDSVQSPALFENIWNDKGWKQVSGFTLLGLSLAGLAMSLRKRIKLKFIQRTGDFAVWRILHLVLGFACAAILFFHTGMHFGENLNFILMCSFVGTIVLGGVTGAALSIGHLIPSGLSRNLRSLGTWAHTLVVWPLPALLSLHILTVYYF